MLRRIAEWLFEKQLDEDFYMGVKEGRRQAKHDITFKLELLLDGANKTKAQGIYQALELVKDHR